MRQRLISILLAFCVLFAPLASSAALTLPSMGHHAPQMTNHAAGCHGTHAAKAGDCETHPMHQAAPQATQHATIDASQSLHGCCLGFAAVALPASFTWPSGHARQEPPAFFTAQPASPRAESIYKPPRQNA